MTNGNTPTHHQYGLIAGDEESAQGFFSLDDAILFGEVSSIAVSAARGGSPIPLIAVAMSGRINKSEDTIGTVWALEPEHAGMLAAHILHAVMRTGSAEAVNQAKEAFDDVMNQ